MLQVGEENHPKDGNNDFKYNASCDNANERQVGNLRNTQTVVFEQSVQAPFFDQERAVHEGESNDE